ncbi:MAG: hypothetical protein PVF83_13240 [Anaerolineales bacterium]|jgi:hypothetical protein
MMDIKFTTPKKNKYRNDLLNELEHQLSNLELGEADKKQEKPTDETLPVDLETIWVFYKITKITVEVFKMIIRIIEEVRSKIAAKNKVAVDDIPNIEVEVLVGDKTVKGEIPGNNRGIIKLLGEMETGDN